MSGDSNEIEIRVTSKDLSAPGFDKAKGRISELERKMLALSRQKIQVDANIADVESDLRKLRAELADPELSRPRMEVRADIDGAKRDLEELKVKAKDIGREKVRISVETREARMEIADLADDAGHRLRKSIGDGIDKGGKDGSKGLGSSLSSSISSVGIVAAVGVAAIFGPHLAALVGGAITLGGVAGVIGLAAYLQKDNPKVQAAAAGLGRQITDGLRGASAQIAEPLIGALHIFQAAFRANMPQFNAMFAAVGGYIEPLARGLAGLVSQALPGFIHMLQSAQPLIEALGEHLPILGYAMSLMFDSIAEAMPGIAAAFGDFMTVLEGALYGIGKLIQGGAWVVEKLHELGGSADDAGRQVAAATPPLTSMAEAQALLAQQTRAARDALVLQARQLLSMRADARGFEAAIDDATDAVKRNGRTLNIHTKAGRENQAALDRIADTTLRWADEATKAGKKQGDVDKIMRDGRRSFINAAVAMGKGADEAARLADELFGIPKTNNIDIRIRTFGNLKAAAAAGRYSDNTSSGYNEGGRRAHGGIVGAFAAGGTVPRAGRILVGEEGPEILEGVPAGSRVRTAGETRQILGGDSAASGPGVVEVRWVGGQAGDEFMSWLRKNIRVTAGTGPGSVQAALGRA